MATVERKPEILPPAKEQPLKFYVGLVLFRQTRPREVVEALRLEGLLLNDAQIKHQDELSELGLVKTGRATLYNILTPDIQNSIGRVLQHFPGKRVYIGLALEGPVDREPHSEFETLTKLWEDICRDRMVKLVANERTLAYAIPYSVFWVPLAGVERTQHEIITNFGKWSTTIKVVNQFKDNTDGELRKAMSLVGMRAQ